MSMEVNKYEYLVNPYSLQGIKNITEVPKGKDFSIVCDCTTEIFMVLYQMAQDHIALVTVPGNACLYDILNICRKDSKVDIELKSTYYKMSDTFVQELIEVRCVGDYYKPKITAKRNDDGSVTFSVPTQQVVTLKQRVHPALSHGDEPGERGEQGGVDNILVLTDKVDVLREVPFRHYSKEIELKCNDKFGAFLEYWQSLPVPRKILFRMEKDSQDVYKVESLRYECGRGFITAQYIGNMCNFKRVDAMFAQNAWIDTMANMCSELEKKNSGHKKEHSELREELLKRYTAKTTPLEDFCDALAMSANIKPKLDVMDSSPTTRRINSVKLNKVTRL